MRVVFVVPENRQWWGDRWGWRFAAVRYRAVIPARELVRRGHEVFVYEVKDPDPVGRFPSGWDAVVLVSSFDRRTEEIAARARREGSRVIADFCDHHFDDSRWTDHYLGLAAGADRVTVATAQLGRVIDESAGRDDWLVVDDPWEGPGGEPRFAPAEDRPLRCLWFGHHLNLATLEAQLPRLAAWARARRRLVLAVLTPRHEGVWRWLGQMGRSVAPWIDLRPVAWAPGSLFPLLAVSDLVLVPSTHHPHKWTKSANRPVEALHAGRMPLCWPLPSYLEIGEFAWIGEDLAAGIEWCLREPGEVVRRIARARELLPARFSPAAVAARWEAILAGRPVRPVPPAWRLEPKGEEVATPTGFEPVFPA